VNNSEVEKHEINLKKFKVQVEELMEQKKISKGKALEHVSQIKNKCKQEKLVLQDKIKHLTEENLHITKKFKEEKTLLHQKF
jgi:hypothetical protein